MSLRPIKGERALMFWSSSNVCNRVRAICAYSKDEEEANLNLARAGYANSFRKRVLDAEGVEFANPLMIGIPFNPGHVPIWECLAERRKGGKWARWDDTTLWDDNNEWQEWIPDETFETAQWIMECAEVDGLGFTGEAVTFTQGPLTEEVKVEMPEKVKKPRKPRKKKEVVDADSKDSEPAKPARRKRAKPESID